MVGDIEKGKNVTNEGSVKCKKEGTQDRALGYSIGEYKASKKILPRLTLCGL